jgi:alginate O-acetyltransferase complex protein AlgI
MVVFVISGLWHGAGWNFILWGLYHGLLLVAYRYVGKSAGMGAGLSWVLTYCGVMLGWLFFMETDTAKLAHKLRTLFDFNSYSFEALFRAFVVQGLAATAILCIVLTLAHGELLRQYLAMKSSRKEPHLPSAAVALVMLCASFLMSAREQSAFVYFAF